MNALGVRVERGERAHRAQEYPHRMGVVVEPTHELLDAFVDKRVVRDVVRPLLELLLRR